MQLIWMASLAHLGVAYAAPDLPETRTAIGAVRAAHALPDTTPLTARTFRFAGGTRTRVVPVIDGLDVYGASWVVAGVDGGPLRVTGEVPPHEVAPLRIDREDALMRAEAAFDDLAMPPHHAELAWLYSDGRLVRAWRVPVVRQHRAPPSPWTVWVAGDDGRLLSTLPSGHSIDALIYPSNPVLSVPERVEMTPDMVDRPYGIAASCSSTDPTPSALALAACEVVEQQAKPDADGNFLFVPRPEAARDPFSEVNAFVHVHRIGTWLEERFAFRTAWTPIDVYVNFPLANAFFGDFDGDGVPDISFGHANGVDLAYDADVVYHEYGHSVVATLAPDLPFLQADELGLDWVSGSINEGAADVFAMLLTDDPEVGEYAGRAFGYQGGIRELSEPRRCPDDLIGEVHADGMIFGATFWQMLADPRISNVAVGELLMGSIALWDRDISWPSAGASIVTTAGDLRDAGAIPQAAHDAMLQHVDAANLVGCDRVQPMDVGEQKRMLLFNAGLSGDFERIVGNVQLRLDPVDGANQLEVVEASDGDIMGWTAFVRRGAPVSHEVVSLEAFGLTVAIPTVYDEQLEGVGQGMIGPFDGEEPVFVMMASRNLDVPALAFVTLQMTVEASRAEQTDAYVPTVRKETQNLGWTCAQAGEPALGLYVLLLVPFARARSSRRRHD